MPADSLQYLALHLAGKFLTEKNRRLLDRSADINRFAHILLAGEYDSWLRQAGAELQKLRAATVLTLADADYPPFLKEINYAPFALYLKGERSILKRELISMVGTREPSVAGRSAAARLAELFVNRGMTVVSGIARGIDSIAHHSALKAGGSTIAVLPNGFNHLYPLENRDLYHEANNSENLLLISEYPPQQKPQRHHFVRRNRIIAGLSALTIFVEGGIKSGAMITANYALSEGREVAALAHASLVNNAGGEKLVGDGAQDFTELARLPSETSRVSA